MPWLSKTSDDATVVHRVRAGRRDDFGVLVDRYLRVAHAVSYAQLRNVTDAEDAAQDAFIKAYEGLDGLRDPAKFGPWLLSIVRNTCRNHKRSRVREAERVDAIAATDHPPAHKLEDRELQSVVRQQVEDLDDIHREVLLLHYYGGRNVKDIAALLELSPEAVRKRLQRAREALSGQMLRHLEPAVAPERAHRDRVTAIVGLLAGVTAAWEAGAASSTGVAAGASAAAVASALASSAIAKIVAAMAVAMAVTGAVVYWPDAPDPAAQDTAQETPIAQNAESASATTSSHLDRTDPTDRSDPSDVSQIAPAVPQSGYFIRGRTIDQSGNPVANATVMIDPYDPATGKHHETEADENGWFLFTDLNRAKYMLQATAFRLFGEEELHSDTAGNSASHEIALHPAGEISGRVQSRDGRAVPDALVEPVEGEWASGRWNLNPRWREIRRVQTDADGRFRIAPVWLGTCKLRVDSLTHVIHETELLPVNDSALITLSPGAHVEGLVVYAGTKVPVPDVKLRMNRDRSAVTDSAGGFVFDGVKPGSESVQVEHDTLLSLTKGFMVPEGGNISGVTIEVVQGGIISGRVYDAQTGKGIRNAEVSLETAGRGSLYAIFDEDERGTFRFTHLRPGTYHVHTVRGPGYPHIEHPAHDPLVVEYGTTIAGIDFGLTKGTEIRGVVNIPPDFDVANLLIRVRYMDHASTIFRGVTWEKRNLDAPEFTIPGLALGEPITLQAKAEGWASETAGPFVLGPDGIDGVTLTLVQQPVGSISGRVVYGGGIPVTDARLDILREGSAHVARPQVNEDGEFSVRGLTPGQYLVRGNAYRTWLPEPIRVSVAPGQDITDLVIDFGGGTDTIAGKVVDDTGVPIKGAEVSARGPGFGGVPGISDENGEFTVQGLERDSYGITARAEGYAYLHLDATPAGTKNLRIVLERTGAVAGRALDGRTGLPLIEFEVAIGEPARQEPQAKQNLLYKRFVNDTGEFRVDQLAPGDHAVVVRAAGLFPSSVPVQVKPGQTTSASDFILRPGAVANATVVNTSGQPLHGAEVFANSWPDLAQQLRPDKTSVKTGPDGTCTLEHLVPGTNLLYVVHPDYAPAEFTLDVMSGASVSPTFTLSKGAALEGVVRINGETALETPISVQYSDAPLTGFEHFHTSTTTDEDGTYRFDGLIPGDALVEVQTSSGTFQRAVEIVRDQTERADFDVHGGTAKVSGSVEIPSGRFGIGAVWVSLTVETADGPVRYDSRADDTGHFRFDNVIAGTGTLVAMTHTADRRPLGKTATLTIPVGDEVTHHFDFTKGSTVRGMVSINSDRPEFYVVLVAGNLDLEELNIATYARTLQMRAVNSQRLTASGPFQFDAVDPGEYTLMVATDRLGQVTGKAVTVPNGESVVTVDISFP